MPLPDFFVIGAPKAGTTALHVALAHHPQLYMSRIKEPKHFLTDGPPPLRGGPGDARTFREYVWRRDDYEALFDVAPSGALRGESTPFYLWDVAAHRRIAAAVPHAKLIAVIRDPVDRAHSNWTHLWSAGLEPEGDFVRACHLERRRVTDGWAPFWRYVELGRYGEQLARLYTTFPRDRVLVLRYRDLRERPRETLDAVAAFLGVEPGVVTEVPAENVTTHVSDGFRNRAVSALLRAGSSAERVLPADWWAAASSWLSRHLQREQRPRQPIGPGQREALLPLFGDDIARLEQLTGESFQDWRDPGRVVARRDLGVDRRIGTGYMSIDRPIVERAD